MTEPGYRAMIRDLPATERPRERLATYGPATLSVPELLAIIWRTGTSRESVLSLANRALAERGGLPGLGRATLAELCETSGIGPAKAAELQAALELGRRLATLHPHDRPQVRSPADAANLVLADMALLDQEQLRVLLMNAKNQVLAVRTIYQGSVNTSQVRVAEVFRDAIRQNCPAIVVIHNHPSGDPTPSTEDIRLTESLVSAGRLLDIEVLDHLVIGQQRFISLRERRLGFTS